MKNIKILKPQPSPKSGRDPLANITNCFHSRPKSQKETYRSPSHSPRNTNRANILQKERRRNPTSKSYLQTCFSPAIFRCINHKERQGKFKIQHQLPICYYCQNCAFELNQKGKKVVVVKNQETSPKMVVEAKQYLRACDDILVTVQDRLTVIDNERYRVESRFVKLKEEILEQRQDIMRKINEQYDRQIRQQQQLRKKGILKLQEEEKMLKNFEREFETLKKDVNQNIKEINVHIEMSQFRQIMDIYWSKVSQFNETIAKPNLQPVVTQSTQVFTAKYLPPDGKDQSKTFEQAIRGGRGKASKEFTFSKNLWEMKGRQAVSWENENPMMEQSESLVQERYKAY